MESNTTKPLVPLPRGPPTPWWLPTACPSTTLWPWHPEPSRAARAAGRAPRSQAREDSPDTEKQLQPDAGAQTGPHAASLAFPATLAFRPPLSLRVTVAAGRGSRTTRRLPLLSLSPRQQPSERGQVSQQIDRLPPPAPHLVTTQRTRQKYRPSAAEGAADGASRGDRPLTIPQGARLIWPLLSRAHSSGEGSQRGHQQGRSHRPTGRLPTSVFSAPTSARVRLRSAAARRQVAAAAGTFCSERHGRTAAGALGLPPHPGLQLP